MPEITIKYKDSRTLEILKSLSKYFDFIISVPESKTVKKEIFAINGVTLTRNSNDEINNDEMNKIFTKNDIGAKELRSKWQRRK